MKEVSANIDIVLNHKLKQVGKNVDVEILNLKKIVAVISMDDILLNMEELWYGENEELLEILYTLKKSISNKECA